MTILMTINKPNIIIIDTVTMTNIIIIYTVTTTSILTINKLNTRITEIVILNTQTPLDNMNQLPHLQLKINLKLDRTNNIQIISQEMLSSEK